MHFVLWCTRTINPNEPSFTYKTYKDIQDIQTYPWRENTSSLILSSLFAEGQPITTLCSDESLFTLPMKVMDLGYTAESSPVLSSEVSGQHNLTKTLVWVWRGHVASTLNKIELKVNKFWIWCSVFIFLQFRVTKIDDSKEESGISYRMQRIYFKWQLPILSVW